MSHIDYARINAAALSALPALFRRWLPSGRAERHEYVALNPTRANRNLGSFRVHLRTGRWAGFATHDRGGVPISLAAYLFNVRQGELACHLAGMLGILVLEPRWPEATHSGGRGYERC